MMRLPAPALAALAVLPALAALPAVSNLASLSAQEPGCLSAATGASSAPAGTLAQPPGAPDELLALIEIPAGGQVKYELHPSGRMEVDRFLSMPVAYPVNYGILPCTLAADGDALDALVLTRIPLLPGSLIRVRPIGLLRMLDRGEEDDKLLAVPLDSVDPTYTGIGGIEDLPAAEVERIEQFFRVYKLLPGPATPVEVGPWEGAAEARERVRRALGGGGGE